VSSSTRTPCAATSIDHDAAWGADPKPGVGAHATFGVRVAPEASWARNAEGVDEQGAAIEVVDRRRDRLVPAARRQREHPTSFIEVREVFGDIAEDARFVEAYPRTLELLHERGARATLAALASDGVRSVPQQLRSPG
jgi:hypothetical protein